MTDEPGRQARPTPPWLQRLSALSRGLTVPRLTLILLALGLLCRTLRYLLGFPLWGDEAFVAVNFVTRDYAEMIRPLEYGQIVPLVFMWAELWLARSLGLSEWALRLLPYLAGVAALLLFWRFAFRVLPRRPAMLAVGFLAASVYAVRHGAELKPYATDLLISIALTMLAWGVFRQPRSAWRWAALIALGGVAGWCSYPAAFVGGSAGLLLTWLLLREKFRPAIAAGWLAFGLVFCGSFLAMYLSYGRPHLEYAARLTEINMWAKTFPPLSQPWKLPVWLILIHTGLMFAYPHGGANGGSVVTLVLVVMGAIHLWRKQPALLLLLLGPLPLTFIAAAMKAYPYGGSVRTSLYLAPALCLLAGLGLFSTLKLARLRGPALRAAVPIAALALAAFPIGNMIVDVLRPYSSKAVLNSYRAVRKIAKQAIPGDRWIVFNATERVDYAPYLGDWRGVGGQFVFDVLRFAPVPLTWAPPPDSVQTASAGYVYLLLYRANSAKVTFPEGQFDAYLNTLTRRLGTARHDSYPVKLEKNKTETIEVYRFGL